MPGIHQTWHKFFSFYWAVPWHKYNTKDGDPLFLFTAYCDSLLSSVGEHWELREASAMIGIDLCIEDIVCTAVTNVRSQYLLLFILQREILISACRRKSEKIRTSFPESPLSEILFFFIPFDGLFWFAILRTFAKSKNRYFTFWKTFGDLISCDFWCLKFAIEISTCRHGQRSPRNKETKLARVAPLHGNVFESTAYLLIHSKLS